MARSRVELMGLEYEAERMVRSDVARAEVARMLGVHQQTLAGWALRGGWRRKDLDMERSGVMTRRVIRNVATAHAWEAAKQSLEAEQVWLMREAGRAIACGDGAGLARLLAAAPEGMAARPVLEAGAVADARVERTQSLGARDGLVGDGRVEEEEVWVGREDEGDEDGWEDGAVAD